jgi:hypothetical protein
MPGEIMAKITAKGGRPESVVIAGLDPLLSGMITPVP